MSNVFRPEQTIGLEIRDRTYLTAVISVRDEQEVVVRAPENSGVPVAPPVNAPVRVIVQEPGQPLTFYSRVLGSRPDADSAALRLAWPVAADRSRRRRHVRVDVIVKAEATPQPRRGEKARPLGALTADVSEGGVRLTVARPIELGSMVHLRMHVRTGDVVECAGRVVRGGATEQLLAPHPYWVAIEFVDLPEATRAEIARLH
jgi:c-di-GMP-binding flagellar brake protein YcgR